MKTILFVLLAVSTAFAQDYSDILSYRGRSLGNDPARQIAKTKEILAAVVSATEAQGIQTKITHLKDRAGNSYPAMVVATTGSHKINLEAARVARLMGNLPLIFSPYDLGRSQANAFFDPAGLMLGVSYDFILGDVLSSSYVHELYHAGTYQQVLSGKASFWAGVMKVTNGVYVSSVNQSYYFRFASLDELPATALSLKLDTENILEMKRSMTPAEFNRARGAGSSLLGEIYLSAQAGYYLARQAQDLAQRALRQIPTTTITNLKLGTFTKPVPTAVFVMESYDRQIISGRGTIVAIKDGTEFRMYSGTTQNLATRLNEIITRAKRAEAAFKAAEKCIYVMIEYPDTAKTDYRCLETQAPAAFGFLN